jgi:guanosine-3',5'-bis(diphosphate) 3'-pyrophosphohydrolase
MTTVLVPADSQEKSLELFLGQIEESNPRVQKDLLEKAFRFSWKAHENQVRKSGEPFLAHPVAVALTLAEQKFDSITIAAGLLHDVLEDTSVNDGELRRQFGEEIALLVDGVTKIKKFQMRSREERQAETYRKMLLSMAQDIRVIVIKFADRLHNLRTLRYLETDRIQAIAAETLDIYAPLAHRMGMARIKAELEDLAFKHLHPQEYREIVNKVASTWLERESRIESFAAPLRRRLDSENIEATIIGRPKHFYSIYRKMIERGKPFEEIYDLLAIRVITRTVGDCYTVLGILHSMWKPLQDRFKDYISIPKSNGYQSLHTTVFGANGEIAEIQLRTWEMHQTAEDGIASHWIYKTGDSTQTARDDQSMVWLRNLIEWQKDLTDSSEFFEFFKIDLFHAEIFVFTPKGDLISLAKGTTVLDFAFAVHTDLGLHCIGAKVDGVIEPVNKPLKSGSTVEILYSSSKKPSIDWLHDVRTAKARSAIRRWLKTAGRQQSIELGKKIVHTQYKKMHLSAPLSDHVPFLLQFLGVNNLDRLYELVGSGEMPLNRIVQSFRGIGDSRPATTKVMSRLRGTFTLKQPKVRVGGSDTLMVRFAKCCTPIPHDPIVGFVTRGRGIVVHAATCPNCELFSGDEDRIMQVAWDEGQQKNYTVGMMIVAEDRPGLLHEISEIFFKFGANVTDGTLKTVHHKANNWFKLEIQNRNQLKQIIKRVQKLKGVEHVSRITGDESHDGNEGEAPETAGRLADSFGGNLAAPRNGE